MPRYDVECVTCQTVVEIVARCADRAVPCATCGTPTARVWRGRAPGAIDDQLPGGARFIENLGDRPVWVETKSQLAREAKARGLVPCVRHMPNPHTGKSDHTSRWT